MIEKTRMARRACLVGFILIGTLIVPAQDFLDNFEDGVIFDGQPACGQRSQRWLHAERSAHCV